MKSPVRLAREAGIINQSVAAAYGHIPEAWDLAIQMLVFKILGLAAEFYSKEDMIRLVGVKIGSRWPAKKLTKGDVQNNLFVSIKRGSMAPRNDGTDFQAFGEFIKLSSVDMTMKAALAPAYLQLLKIGLRAAFGVRGETLLEQVDPQAVAQLAMAPMMQGLLGGQMEHGGKPSAPSPAPPPPGGPQ